MSNGKGDLQRPTDKEKFDTEYERIFGRREISEYTKSLIIPPDFLENSYEPLNSKVSPNEDSLNSNNSNDT